MDVVNMIVKECSEAHKRARQKWEEGDIQETWIDDKGNICIKYESGNWWHYRNNNGTIVWW